MIILNVEPGLILIIIEVWEATWSRWQYSS
jgi:hypothetical protein